MPLFGKRRAFSEFCRRSMIVNAVRQGRSPDHLYVGSAHGYDSSLYCSLHAVWEGTWCMDYTDSFSKWGNWRVIFSLFAPGICNINVCSRKMILCTCILKFLGSWKKQMLYTCILKFLFSCQKISSTVRWFDSSRLWYVTTDLRRIRQAFLKENRTSIPWTCRESEMDP